MQRPQLFGLETESSILTPRGDETVRAIEISRVLKEAARRFVHLPGRGSSRLFFANGACLYAEGQHPECCTPEVSSPFCLVRYAAACDRMLAELGTECNVTIYKFNVDYNGAKFGSHESYCHTISPSRLPEKLIPHLVTRVIYTGAGGFDPQSPGIEFRLSPRAAYIHQITGSQSTSSRPLVHDKNEPLAKSGLNRLHLILGDSLMSHTALLLRFGTTALILAAIELGIPLHEEQVALKAPVKALHTFAADPTCTATVEANGNQHLSALHIQRHYLGIVEAHCREKRMPDWAPEVCQLWRSELNRLARGPQAVRGRLDWATKWWLYSDFIARRGFSWSTLAEWTPVLTAVAAAQGLKGRAQIVRYNSIDRRKLNEVIQLRQQLFELDLRYSQLGDHGLFAQLERSGALDHRQIGVTDDQAPDIDPIVAAMTEPPSGRAGARGRAIMRYARKKSFAADWQGIFDLDRCKMLDMSDPFATTYDWTDMPPEQDHPFEVPHPAVDLARLYRCGDFTRAMMVIDAESVRMRARVRGPAALVSREAAWIHARYGAADSASMVDEVYRNASVSITMVGDYLNVLRYRYLKPCASMVQWAERAHPLLEQADLGNGQAVVSREYIGWYELSLGRVNEALQWFHDGFRGESNGGMSDERILARLKCGMAEAHRRLELIDAARSELREASCLQRVGGYRADLAGNLAIHAKLEPNRRRALFLLCRARGLQTELGDRIALTRTLLIEARLTGSRLRQNRIHEQLQELQQQVPALQSCPTFAQMMQEWTQWSTTLSPDQHGDVFWGI